MKKIFVFIENNTHYLCTKGDETGGCLRKTIISEETYDFIRSHPTGYDLNEYKKELKKQTSTLRELSNEPGRNKRKRKLKKEDSNEKSNVVKENPVDFYKEYLKAYRSSKSSFRFKGIKFDTKKEELTIKYLKTKGLI